MPPRKTPSTTATTTSETEIILNRANVALSRSQRLVSSWLTLPATDDDEHGYGYGQDKNAGKTEEEIQREEDEMFTAVPETLGVGAPLPTKAADGSWNRTELGSNDILRKQLLGRNYDRVMKAKAAAAAPAGTSTTSGTVTGTGSGSGTAAGADSTLSDDDEEEGRAAMVGKKRKTSGGGGSAAGSGSAAGTATEKQGKKGKKGKTSYLDEILAQRKKKRR